jgi:hypothetical protein
MVMNMHPSRLVWKGIKIYAQTSVTVGVISGLATYKYLQLDAQTSVLCGVSASLVWPRVFAVTCRDVGIIEKSLSFPSSSVPRDHTEPASPPPMDSSHYSNNDACPTRRSRSLTIEPSLHSADSVIFALLMRLND